MIFSCSKQAGLRAGGYVLERGDGRALPDSCHVHWLAPPPPQPGPLHHLHLLDLLSAHPQAQIGAPRSSHIVTAPKKCTFAKESLGSRQQSQWETGAGVTKEIHPL